MKEFIQMANNTGKMEYYYENEAEQFVFYRVPKMLFKDKRFSNISSDAKRPHQAGF